MTTTWDDLAAAALLGTERRSVDAAALPGPLGEAAAALASTDRATALLDAAALATPYRRAGMRPPASETAPRDPAESETTPSAGPAATGRLAQLLQSPQKRESAELLQEWLAAAADAGLVVRPETLPALLDAAARDGSLGAAAAPVLGNRGRWLAQFRPDWTRVLTRHAAVTPSRDDLSAWETGDTASRRSLFAALRTSDPAAARDLLASSWSRETGEDREAFVDALATGLGPADEPLLEAALGDRRGAVRSRAAELLRRLPESAYAERMRQRVAGVVRLERRLLRSKLVVTPPPPPDEAALRDDVDPKRPPNVGEQAWRLRALVVATPLSVWPDVAGATPEQLVSATVDGGWRNVLLEAWSAAAIGQSDPAWASALLGVPGPHHDPAHPGPLVGALKPADRVRHVAAALRARSAKPDPRLPELLASVPRPWPAEIADAALDWLRRDTSAARDWTTVSVVELLCHRLPPSTAPAVTRLADRAGHDSPLHPVLLHVAHVLTFRHAMLEELR